ncbi:acyltransferase family protein [Aquirufa salirivi]|uniref:Acyltransferase n=1 Tax=Aquirufa salirivi TaxID=3104729 RepID=A0ABW8RTZ8_9BACT
MSVESKTKLLPLESLRGIAALVVALLHFQIAKSFFNENFLVKNGDLMVDLFFVLSGFVIAYNYSGKIGNISELLSFQKKRFWRLYPLHVVTLFAFIAIEISRYYVGIINPASVLKPAFENSGFWAFISNLFLLQSFTGHSGSFNGPSWSISVEFYVYVVFGLFSLLNLKLARRTFIVFLIIIASCGMLLTIRPESPLDVPHSALFARCMYSFFLGVFFYLIQGLIPFRGSTFVSLLFLLGSGYLIFEFAKTPYEWLIPIFLGMTICFISTLNPQNWLYKLLSFKPTVWLGKVSYSIYLIHGIVWAVIGAIVKFVFGNSGEVIHGVRYFTFPFYTSIGIHIMSIMFLLMVSSLTWKYIEVRFNYGKRIK